VKAKPSTEAGPGSAARSAPDATAAPVQREHGRDPLTLRIAVWLLASEAAALGLLAALLLYRDLAGGAQTPQGAIGVIGYVTVIAAALGVLSWQLRARRAWARGAAVVAHMFMLPLGIAITTGGQTLIGVPVLLAGVGGCVVLLAPATRIAIGRE
jgi:hypothetical protein